MANQVHQNVCVCVCVCVCVWLKRRHDHKIFVPFHLSLPSDREPSLVCGEAPGHLRTCWCILSGISLRWTDSPVVPLTSYSLLLLWWTWMIISPDILSHCCVTCIAAWGLLASIKIRLSPEVWSLDWDARNETGSLLHHSQNFLEVVGRQKRSF